MANVRELFEALTYMIVVAIPDWIVEQADDVMTDIRAAATRRR